MAETPTATARATVVGRTDVGRVREHNEDSFLVMNRTDGRRGANSERFEAVLDGALLLVVCDGMGGAAAGEVASRMAADRMATDLGGADFTNSSPDQIASLMDHAVQQANVDIHEAAKANPSQKGMGTTMTAAVVTPERLFVSQVGDSRAYLLRKGQLNQLTKDQSLIGQLIEEGTLTEEEAEKLGGRNIVLQAVGVEESLRVDTKYWPVLRGDVLLVCSDGLSGMVKDEQLKEILAATGDDPGKAAENLIGEANKNGGRDNVTAIVARFDGDGLRPPMEASGDGEIDKAGVAFKAPPPPDVPNPMKRMYWVGLIVLAAIALLWLALRRTTATIEVSAVPADAPVEITVKAADGRTYTATATNGTATITGVRPSEDQDFEVVATSPGCYPHTKKVGIKEAVTVSLDVAPVPIPGKELVIVSKTPRVWVRIQVPSRHKQLEAYDQKKELPEANKERKFERIPSGEVTVTATRDGFRDWTVKEKLAPDGNLRIEVPDLTAIMGAVVVTGLSKGAVVEVIDSNGDPIGREEAQNDRVRIPVRTGSHSVRVTARGYEEQTRNDVLVKEGADTTLDLQLKVKRTGVRFTGAEDTQIEIFENTNAGPRSIESDIIKKGKSGTQLLGPGNYVVKYKVGGQWKEETFSVAADDGEKEIALK